MLAELYNWPHVGDLHRGGHASDRASPLVPGQASEPCDREDGSDSTHLTGGSRNGERGSSSGHRSDGRTAGPEPGSPSRCCFGGQVSAHDYNCNEEPRADPDNCNSEVTFGPKV